MAHTPGPWAFDDDYPGHVFGANGTPICEVFGESARGVECDDNQALIRRAPELLDALRWIAGHSYTTQAADLIDHARAAVAKAEGRAE